MLKTIISNLKNCFSSVEKSVKSIVFSLVPFMTLFLIMSDRTPYNYITFALYGIETVLIIFYVFKYHNFVFDIFSALLFIFLVTILTSQLINFSLTSYPRTILLLTLFSLIFYQFLITLSHEEKTLVYKLLVFGGVLFVIFFTCFYFKELMHLDFGDRLGRDFSDQNDLAKNIAVFGILGEVIIFKVKGKKKIFYIISALLFTALIFVTGSISNLLVFLILSTFLLFFMNKGKKKIIVGISIIVVCATFVAFLQLPFMSYYKTRITNMFNSLFYSTGSVDSSFVDRFYLAFYGLRLFTSKPIFGYGYDQVQFYTWGKNAFSHNNFVELLASFGIFGFLVFEAILLFPIIKNWKQRDKELSIYSLLYLFSFQLFLIIFRKKIEYFIIPLAFSLIHYPVYKGLSLSVCDKKIRLSYFCEFKSNGIVGRYYSLNI